MFHLLLDCVESCNDGLKRTGPYIGGKKLKSNELSMEFNVVEE